MTERRVIVQAPQGQDARLATQVLGSAGIESFACDRPQDITPELERGAGALLVMEETLRGPVLATLARFLARQPAWSDLPILVMGRRGADSVTAQRLVEQLGNVTMLERPVRTITLVSAVRAALRARDRQYEMRELNRRKDQFLATLAHELRNPLTPIRNATAIMGRMQPTPELQRVAGIVDRQVTHLTRLVDDLLDVARITNGKLELQRAPTTMARVLTHALEIADGAIAAQGHRVSVKQPAHEVVLHADHVRVVQSVANLLVNAAKFTPRGGEIAVEARIEGNIAEFSVTDNGQGLEPEALERIFGMFEQARTAGEPSGGLGLGLHLAKAFTELHGGTACASSDGPGHGSRFVLRLPVVVATPVTAEGPKPPAARPMPGKVLVADDNEDAASTLEALLSLHGVNVSVVHDGAEAVAAVCADRPDAVIMDIGMPVMNGYDAARMIRERLPTRTPVLIALTGWGQEDDKARATQAGFDCHLVKPLDLNELLSCLATAAGTG